MAACHNPTLALKVLEAAKLMNVEVVLDQSDLTLFELPEHANLQKKLEKLNQVSSKDFQKAFRKTIKSAKPGEALVLGDVVEKTKSFWSQGKH